MPLTKHLKLPSPKPPSLNVFSLARVGPFTEVLLSVSGALPTMQGSFGNTLLDGSSGEEVCKSTRHKRATFSKSRECVTHSKKHRGRRPLSVSLSDFKTARWETSQLQGRAWWMMKESPEDRKSRDIFILAAPHVAS